MLLPHLNATTGEAERKRKKIVIRKIIRKTKKAKTTETNTPDGPYTPPTPEDKELESGTAVPNPGDSMDTYAEASCKLEALRLSEPAVEADDTLASTLADANTQPVVEVADSQSDALEHKMEIFMEEQADDRLRLPEEETLQNEFPENEHGENASGHGEVDEHEQEKGPLSTDVPLKKHGDDSNGTMDVDEHADRAGEDAPLPSSPKADDHDSAWQDDKTWESRQWSQEWTAWWDSEHHHGHWNHYDHWNGDGHDSYEHGFQHGYGNRYGNEYWDGYGGCGGYSGYGGYNGYSGYGYYSSGGYTPEQKTPTRPVQRSKSVESGLSDLTSISAIHAKMNRLDTPDSMDKTAGHLAAAPVVAETNPMPDSIPPGKEPDDKNLVPMEVKSNSDGASRGNDERSKHEHDHAGESQPVEAHRHGEAAEQNEGEEPGDDGDHDEDRTFYLCCFICSQSIIHGPCVVRINTIIIVQTQCEYFLHAISVTRTYSLAST